MPKQTFFNLAEEKRSSIIGAAMDEFASAGYDLSSIQKIIKASGISRGSFYQYFEDKSDLFVEIMVEISHRKMVYLKPVMDRDEDLGLFELMKELVKAGVEFGMNDPDAFQIAKGLSASKTLDMPSFIKSFKEVIFSRIKISEELIFANSIKNSMERGEIDPRYSFETILSYSNKIMENMSELYWNHMLSHNDIHAGDKILDEVIHLLRYGLSSTNQPGQEAGKDD